MCAIGFLLIIYHISNGETNVVSAGLNKLYVGIPVILSVIGFGMSIREKGNNIGKWLGTYWFALVYIVLRLMSCLMNGLAADPGFWMSLCFEVMFLIAINKATVSTTAVRSFLCLIIAFDLIAVSICTYHFFFMDDLMITASQAYPEAVQMYLPFTLVFTNPNPAGMLAGISASICLLMLRDASKMLKGVLFGGIIVNVAFLIWTNSRTAMTGTILVFAAAIICRFVKRINYKALLVTVLTICIGFMIPVYVVTLTAGHEDQLTNSKTEVILNDKSSGRYNLWKENILTQKGHYILGFGTPAKAVSARSAFVKESENDEAVSVDLAHQAIGVRTDLGAHNGYMENILSAGLPAALLAFAFLFSKILKMDNGFIKKNPVILLLVFLFWINVQESRFIVSSVKYTAFLMMLLLNWGDDEKTE